MAHLNRRQIQQLALATLAIEAVNDIEKDSRFKAGLADLKRGRSFLYRGVRAIGETMDEADKKKFVRVPDTYKVVIVPITSPKKDETIVSTEALASLAEFAIGKECVGCTREDWRRCRLREALVATGAPEANENKGDCRYKQ